MSLSLIILLFYCLGVMAEMYRVNDDLKVLLLESRAPQAPLKTKPYLPLIPPLLPYSYPKPSTELVPNLINNLKQLQIVQTFRNRASRGMQVDIPLSIADGRRVPFIQHIHYKNAMENYLAMNLEYGAVDLAVNSINNQFELHRHNDRVQVSRDILDRNEAHLTVVSPVEYNSILKQYISIERIHRIATEMNIQHSVVVPVCVGQVNRPMDLAARRGEARGYFLVCKSQNLMAIRQRIIQEIKLHHPRADLKEFSPFYEFHITLGFVNSDVHFGADGLGIHKIVSSCINIQTQLKDSHGHSVHLLDLIKDIKTLPFVY